MASALELPLAGSPDAPASTAADIPSRSASTYLEAPDRERPTDAASSVSQNLTVAASPDCLGPTVAAFQDAEHAGNVVNVEMNMPKRNDLPPVTDGDDSDSSSDYKPLRCGPGVHCLQRANNPQRLECGCHFSWGLCGCPDAGLLLERPLPQPSHLQPQGPKPPWHAEWNFSHKRKRI
jgi:hypothetical protein